ncbi:Nitrate reductase 2 [Hibiscus syriacus]|uniref:Nitrate reductase 2 n=1 Tax=Hibiscus syriacus TaxID=106335 RepID=A0A6A2XIP7_HIBSY|nr:Nitrate reductase 2 [Hibiscus syriacus]
MIIESSNEVEPSIFDPRDEATANNWIQLNPSIVRLTGKHPFNSESPLNRLMHQGFITPIPLHYVRNHGPVPKASWDNWTVEVTGLVKIPMKLTMHQLVNEFQSRGPGVPLCDVLKRSGIFGKKHGLFNVCFGGAEDLPGGGGSKYGTSIKEEFAMDPSRDIILAYMQNGERLTPDHGFPVRMIIPDKDGAPLGPLAGGETWQMCTMDHREKPNKYGKFWCWCFWSLEVEVLDLLGAKEIAVREPGMKPSTPSSRSSFGMSCFRAPNDARQPIRGWIARERYIEKSAHVKPTLKRSVSTPFMNTASKTFSMSEVQKHNSADSAWIIVHGNIYDCIRFLNHHHGGADNILINAGADCTEEFNSIHSDIAKKMLEDYRIGELITTGYASGSSTSSPNNSMHGTSNYMNSLAPTKEIEPSTGPVGLVSHEKIPCKLVEKTSISHDVVHHGKYIEGPYSGGVQGHPSVGLWAAAYDSVCCETELGEDEL